MKPLRKIFILLILLFLSSPAFAQTTGEEANEGQTAEVIEDIQITTKEQLKQAIQKFGLVEAIKQSLAIGVLTGTEITSAALESNFNPNLIIITLITAGVSQNDIISTASEAGINAEVIASAVQTGNEQKAEQLAEANEDNQEKKEETTEASEETAPEENQESDEVVVTVDTTVTETEETGLGFGDNDPLTPPDIIAGFPGGADPEEPVSKVIP